MLLTHLDKAFADCKRDLLFVGLFSLAINFLVLTLPIYSLQLFDRVLSSASLDTFLLPCLVRITVPLESRK
ncbi:hypothetical protein ASV53_15155 [Photobacterium sanguinicancri]|uniref:ABC transmembrane type-1 domain-containing protein n=1 Tax=Photobacterium sanguinicancri TaxID=875932 RepID=A0ABX4FVZ3_9GAMM|nr:hypothetical protein ASV53_15155 [Photobacterium sanguinicancri]